MPCEENFYYAFANTKYRASWRTFPENIQIGASITNVERKKRGLKPKDKIFSMRELMRQKHEKRLKIVKKKPTPKILESLANDFSQHIFGTQISQYKAINYRKRAITIRTKSREPVCVLQHYFLGNNYEECALYSKAIAELSKIKDAKDMKKFGIKEHIKSLKKFELIDEENIKKITEKMEKSFNTHIYNKEFIEAYNQIETLQKRIISTLNNTSGPEILLATKVSITPMRVLNSYWNRLLSAIEGKKMGIEAQIYIALGENAGYNQIACGNNGRALKYKMKALELIPNNIEVISSVATDLENIGRYTKADEFWLRFAIKKFEGRDINQNFKRTSGHNSEVGEIDDKLLYRHIAKRVKYGNAELRKEGIITQFVYNTAINKQKFSKVVAYKENYDGFDYLLIRKTEGKSLAESISYAHDAKLNEEDMNEFKKLLAKHAISSLVEMQINTSKKMSKLAEKGVTLEKIRLEDMLNTAFNRLNIPEEKQRYLFS